MTTTIKPGDRLAGKYKVERVIGAGGMGVVLAARHEELHQAVAIKVMSSAAARDDESRRRFLREARAAARLSGAHVARVHDVGTLEDGDPFMVMELLEGEDLGRRLERSGPLPIDEATEIILQTAEALAEAHAQGIVHRDIKPSNLFLVRGRGGTPLVKVLDFGISKANPLGDEGGAITSTDSMMGSPRYMSPEQMKSAKDADARSDIWSLGVTLYELLTARAPFAGQTVGQIFASVLQGPPRPLRVFRADAPEALERVIAKCLEKEPAERYPDVGAFAEDLTRGLELPPESVSRARRIVITIPPAGDRLHSDASGTDPTIAATTANPTTRGTRRSIAALGVVLVAAVTAFVVFRAPAPVAPAAPVAASPPTPTPSSEPTPLLASAPSAAPSSAPPPPPPAPPSSAPPKLAAPRASPSPSALATPSPSPMVSVVAPPKPPADPFEERK